MILWSREEKTKGYDKPSELDLIFTQFLEYNGRYVCPTGNSDHVIVEVESAVWIYLFNI